MVKKRPKNDLSCKEMQKQSRLKKIPVSQFLQTLNFNHPFLSNLSILWKLFHWGLSDLIPFNASKVENCYKITQKYIGNEVMLKNDFKRINLNLWNFWGTHHFYQFQILRNHVMVRVGGGWDTLQHYLDKHDPCRCRTGKYFLKSIFEAGRRPDSA